MIFITFVEILMGARKILIVLHFPSFAFPRCFSCLLFCLPVSLFLVTHLRIYSRRTSAHIAPLMVVLYPTLLSAPVSPSYVQFSLRALTYTVPQFWSIHNEIYQNPHKTCSPANLRTHFSISVVMDHTNPKQDFNHPLYALFLHPKHRQQQLSAHWNSRAILARAKITYFPM